MSFPLSSNKYNLRNNIETEGFKYKYFLPLGVVQRSQHMWLLKIQWHLASHFSCILSDICHIKLSSLILFWLLNLWPDWISVWRTFSCLLSFACFVGELVGFFFFFFSITLCCFYLWDRTGLICPFFHGWSWAWYQGTEQGTNHCSNTRPFQRPFHSTWWRKINNHLLLY